MAKRVLAKVSTDDLAAELQRRNRGLKSLERKRDRLVKQLEELNAQIRSMGGLATSGPGGRKRPRNAMNLQEALVKLLRNKTLSVTEIAEEVQKAGYKTSSENFRTIVNQTLITSPAFKRVSRGKYTTKANYK